MRQNQSFHSLRERVTFFARAKKVTKESTVCRFEDVFAEATSLCLRRTAHFLCAVESFAFCCSKIVMRFLCRRRSTAFVTRPGAASIRRGVSAIRLRVALGAPRRIVSLA